MTEYQMRTVEELTQIENPAWEEIQELINETSNDVKILPITETQGLNEIFKLQVTARSYLGALGLNCGGIVTNHGWLKILGGGHATLPSVSQASGIKDEHVDHIIVAFDVTGGVFAVDGGGLGFTPGSVCYFAPGSVCYFAPDTLSWVDLEVPHSVFVQWAIDGSGFVDFYEKFLFNGWEEETKNIPGNYGYSWFPPLFTVEWTQSAVRRPVPLKELLIAHTGIDFTFPNN